MRLPTRIPRIIFDPAEQAGCFQPAAAIYALATGKTIEQAAAEFDGKGYGEFKPAVGEAVVELLRPIREKTTDLLNNKDYLEQRLQGGRTEGLLSGAQNAG